jgi:hypothetical protein
MLEIKPKEPSISLTNESDFVPKPFENHNHLYIIIYYSPSLKNLSHFKMFLLTNTEWHFPPVNIHFSQNMSYTYRHNSNKIVQFLICKVLFKMIPKSQWNLKWWKCNRLKNRKQMWVLIWYFLNLKIYFTWKWK